MGIGIGVPGRGQSEHAATGTAEAPQSVGNGRAGKDSRQFVDMAEGAVVPVFQQAVEHEHAEHEVEPAARVVRITPVDGGSGDRVAGGACEGPGCAMAITSVEIGGGKVEEMKATAEVMVWAHGRSRSGVRL